MVLLTACVNLSADAGYGVELETKVEGVLEGLAEYVKSTIFLRLVPPPLKSNLSLPVPSGYFIVVVIPPWGKVDGLAALNEAGLCCCLVFCFPWLWGR